MTESRRFTCEDAFRKLNDFLDHELSGQEMRLFREHLEVCAACAREYRFEARVLEHVRDRAREFAVPPNLMAKVFGRLAELGREREGAPPAGSNHG